MRITKEGYPFIVGTLAAALLFTWLAFALQNGPLGWAAGVVYGAAGFCAYFFRDPKRAIPSGDRLILSPADGKVVDVSEGKDPAWTEPVWVLRIFLSVFEPHLQRAPVAGTVRAIRYTKGKFLDARHPQAHFENEQNRLEISPSQLKSAGPIVVTQIAGLIARRIVCWVNESQALQAGELFGLIRFGSQVDMVLPKSAQLKVKLGDHVKAGSTIIAEAPEA